MFTHNQLVCIGCFGYDASEPTIFDEALKTDAGIKVHHLDLQICALESCGVELLCRTRKRRQSRPPFEYSMNISFIGFDVIIVCQVKSDAKKTFKI